ncbi:MAG: CvpA family protein [Desulfovibrio sp.]|nr:CvpA family protein [Desulfovibrio sp.]
MGNDIFDLAILLTLAFFAIRGVRNGFIEEIAGIVAIFAAFWAAKVWNADLAPYLSFISDPGLRPLAASVLLFIAVMIAVGILARILKKIAAFSFIGWLDKLGGFLLGLTKGALLWALIVIALQKIMPDAEFLRDSRVVPYFSTLIDQLKDWLPQDLGGSLGA